MLKPSKYVHNFVCSMNTIFQKYINFLYLKYTNFQNMYTILYTIFKKWKWFCIFSVYNFLNNIQFCTFNLQIIKNVYNYVYSMYTIFQRKYIILYI